MNCCRTVKIDPNKPIKVFGHVKKDGDTRCNKVARVFFRVIARVNERRDQPSKTHEAAYGFCEACACGMDKPASWNKGTAWYHAGGVRGFPWSAEAVDVQPVSCEEAARFSTRHADIKDSIKSMMRRRNAEKISLDDWRQIFDDVLREFPTEEVMNQ